MSPGYRPGDREYRRVAVSLFAAGVATFALLYCAQPVLPVLAREFDLTPAQSALSVSVTTLGLGVALLVAGTLSDVVGRTLLMHLSLASSALVGLLVAWSPNWPVLLVLRGVQGVVLAGLPAVAVAYLREEIAPEARGRATGLYIGGTALGGMSGRLVVGAVAEAAGWRWAIVAVALIGIGCAVSVWQLLPRSRNFRPAPRDGRRLAAMTRRSLSDPALLGLYGIGAASMGAFVGVYNTIGFRLESAPYLLGVGVAGLVYLTYSLGSVSSLLAGRAADRWGHRAVMPVAALVMLAGLLGTLATPLGLIVAALCVFSMGFFAVHAVASGWVAARAGAGGRAAGQAASVYLFCYYLGSSVFGSLAGSAWTRGAWPAVVALTGSLAVVLLVLAAALRRVPALRHPEAGRVQT